MAMIPRRVFALLTLIAWGAASAQIAIPLLGSRGAPEAVEAQELSALIESFTAELRAQVEALGVPVTHADMITPGIAGALDPEYTSLIAELDGVRYAVSGEIAIAGQEREQTERFVVNLIVVDAEQDRASDLISRPLEPAEAEDVAVALARAIVDFIEQAASLPVGDAGLFVSSQPVEAEVYVDGVRVGLTPSEDVLMLAPGRYRLELRKEGFLPEVRTVELRARATTFESVQLAPISGGSILVESQPSAEVFLGETSYGFTPVFIPAPPGLANVRLERDGFLPQAASVPVRNYRTSRLDLHLEPVQEPLLFWDQQLEYFVLVEGAVQPHAYAWNARPGINEVEIRRGRDQRSYRIQLPREGVFELDLETGAVERLR